MGVKLTNTNKNKATYDSLQEILQTEFFVVNKPGVIESGTLVSVKEVAGGPVFFLRRQAA